MVDYPECKNCPYYYGEIMECMYDECSDDGPDGKPLEKRNCESESSIIG